MLYVAVKWTHSVPDEPVMLYHELDDKRYEQRKVYVFSNGAIQFADATHEQDNTALSWEPIPMLDEIRHDPQFEVQEITKECFEEVWNHAQNE